MERAEREGALGDKIWSLAAEALASVAARPEPDAARRLVGWIAGAAELAGGDGAAALSIKRSIAARVLGSNPVG